MLWGVCSCSFCCSQSTSSPYSTLVRSVVAAHRRRRRSRSRCVAFARTHAKAANMAASLTAAAAAPPPPAAGAAPAPALAPTVSLAVLTTSVICCKLQTATISQRTPPPHSNGAKQHGRQLWPRIVRMGEARREPGAESSHQQRLVEQSVSI